MKEEYLKTYTWMNTLRGGMLRDVYALIYQLQRKSEVKVTVAYIAERLGYSNRSVQYAIAELKEMGLLEVGYADGKRSIFKALNHANLAPLEKASNPRKVCTPANLAPLQDLHPTPANLAPPTPYITKDNIVDNSSSSSPACARERLQKWFEESSIKEWANMLIQRNHFDKDITALLDDFFDNDFEVREDCEQSRRMEVLKHFQNWLPKYIHKIKQPNNNGNNNHQTSGQRVTNLEDIARSIMAGCQAGRAGRK